ncbi:type I-G CRISPR-associated protein Csb2 [Dyella sp. KRB-257]|uniref:type I-G CRISPR-associated protein Csb2 n=1 Tax=Dyella sp. KRB-257 TaxID=3400915 RepID=UPI003C08BABF
MLALAFTFPAGKYHATPWSRHVNEGAVVWPPEPWRVLRALIATWHHKIKPLGKHEEATLAALIDSLSQALPEYALPAASHSHTRHYMPQWKAGDTSLVFDAFAAVARDEALVMAWPQLDLPGAQAALLDDLLAALGYLGRAESWVEAARFDGPFKPDCKPGNVALDPSTGELHEVVTLLAPLPAGEYGALRGSFLADKKAARKLGSTLPSKLLDALSVETADLRKQGWSQPPAAQKVAYLRPIDALRPKRLMHEAVAAPATTVRYMLIGKPLPRVEDSVRIGELLRRAVMSEAKKQLGESAIPSAFSGHGLPAGTRHRHAFYLPWDANGDGRIDRVIVHRPGGLAREERRVVEKLRRLWSRDGGEWQLVLENIGDAPAGGPLLATAPQWQSVTPYMHPWHAKKNFGVEDQIRRECRERGLPEPQVEALPTITINGRPRRSIHFHRFRDKRGLNQPDRHGSFWRMTFTEPVSGPIALGFGCHFGLGLFQPVA